VNFAATFQSGEKNRFLLRTKVKRDRKDKMRIIDPNPGRRRIVKRHGHETAGFSLVELTMTPGRRLDSLAALARAQRFRTATVSVNVHTSQRVEFCGHDHDDSADEMV